VRLWLKKPMKIPRCKNRAKNLLFSGSRSANRNPFQATLSADLPIHSTPSALLALLDASGTDVKNGLVFLKREATGKTGGPLIRLRF